MTVFWGKDLGFEVFILGSGLPQKLETNPLNNHCIHRGQPSASDLKFMVFINQLSHPFKTCNGTIPAAICSWICRHLWHSFLNACSGPCWGLRCAEPSQSFQIISRRWQSLKGIKGIAQDVQLIPLGRLGLLWRCMVSWQCEQRNPERWSACTRWPPWSAWTQSQDYVDY